MIRRHRNSFSFLLLFAFSPVYADIPDHMVPTVGPLVLSRLKNSGFVEKKINNESSQQVLEKILSGLDSSKLIFNAEDIAKLKQQYGEQLDEAIAAGDMQPMEAIFALYVRRLEQVVRRAETLKSATFDFTKDEFAELDPNDYANAGTALEERFRRRFKLALLAFQLDDAGLSVEEAKDSIIQIYKDQLARMKSFDQDQMLEVFLNAWAGVFDPHSAYLSPDTMENFKIHLSNRLEGIGAALGVKAATPIVEKLIAGGPAFNQGELKVGDKIVAVSANGEEGSLVDCRGMQLNDVVKLIRGEPGTKVLLKVDRGDGETQLIEIERDQVNLQDADVAAALLEQNGKTIAVISVPSFYADLDAFRKGDRNYKSVARDVKNAFQKLEKRADSIDALVLDLRNNGGGFLLEAVNLVGHFIERGPVVQVKGRRGSQTFSDFDQGELIFDGPVAVSVNGGSASASEVVAAALQDYGRALIIGSGSTHGKGSVQAVNPLKPSFLDLLTENELPELGFMKVTEQLYYRVTGKGVQKLGVKPDVYVPSRVEEVWIKETDIPFAIEPREMDTAEFEAWSKIPRSLLSDLETKSESRRQQSEAFKTLEAYLKAERGKESRNRISLNLDKRRQEQIDEAAKHGFSFFHNDEGNFELEVDETGRLKDYRNREIINIVVDYANHVPARLHE